MIIVDIEMIKEIKNVMFMIPHVWNVGLSILSILLSLSYFDVLTY